MAKWLIIIALLVLITIVSVYCQEDEELKPSVETDDKNSDDWVVELDDSVYQSFVEKNRVSLVEFYAPWCGHCKALEPEYSSAAKILAEDNISLGKIDGTKYSDFARSHDIQGYPTMFVYLNGNKIEYDGPRTSQGIVDHMRKIADPNYKPPEESVITLTDSNFDAILESESLILVEFYAPWCGHCKKLKPEYERAARRLLQMSVPIKLAKVDATVEKELASKFEIKGYPTLKIFRNGGKKVQPYKGPRDENGIVSYMKEMQKSPSKIIHSREQLRKQIRDEIPTIVGLFDTSSDSSFLDLFLDVAYDQFDESNHFVHIENVKLIEDLKLKPNSLLLFTPLWFRNKYEPNKFKLELDQSTTLDQVKQFITKHSIPLVGFRTGQTYSLYADKFPLIVVYFDVDFGFDNRKQTQLILSQVQKAASHFKGKGYYFIIAREQDNEQELTDLRLDDSGEDVNVAYFHNSRKRYAMTPTDEFNAEKIIEFVKQVENNEISPIIRSAPTPMVNPVKNLWTVVGDTFEKLVINAEKDSLVEFYAPWCGHCKSLEPIYKELAEKFEVESNVIQIMKIDATVNDYPEQFDVKGFPTLYYVRANDPLHPISYEGERTLDDLTKFVHENLHQAKDEL